MLLFASAPGAAHHEPDAMHHVMDTYEWEFFQFLEQSIHLPKFISKFQILMILAAALVCWIYIPLAKKIQTGAAPKGVFWNLFESILTFIRDNIAKPYIPHHTDHYVPFLWTMFLFVLICNLLGMIPFLGSPTASLSMTGTLAIIVFAFIHFSGIRENGVKGHLLAFAPHLDMPPALRYAILALLWPIEFMGLIIKCFVLAVRLFANMFAGHMVLSVILLFIWQARYFTAPLFWTVTFGSVFGATALSLLELFVAFLQAFIFTFLTALFLGSVTHPEH